jgi:hypothetical protein
MHFCPHTRCPAHECSHHRGGCPAHHQGWQREQRGVGAEGAWESYEVPLERCSMQYPADTERGSSPRENLNNTLAKLNLTYIVPPAAHLHCEPSCACAASALCTGSPPAGGKQVVTRMVVHTATSSDLRQQPWW